MPAGRRSSLGCMAGVVSLPEPWTRRQSWKLIPPFGSVFATCPQPTATFRRQGSAYVASTRCAGSHFLPGAGRLIVPQRLHVGGKRRSAQAEKRHSEETAIGLTSTSSRTRWLSCRLRVRSLISTPHLWLPRTNSSGPDSGPTSPSATQHVQRPEPPQPPPSGLPVGPTLGWAQ